MTSPNGKSGFNVLVIVRREERVDFSFTEQLFDFFCGL